MGQPGLYGLATCLETTMVWGANNLNLNTVGLTLYGILGYQPYLCSVIYFMFDVFILITSFSSRHKLCALSFV